MTWYCKPTAGHDRHGQSVICDEGDGRSVAIVYDGAKDGALLAAAPLLLAALERIRDKAGAATAEDVDVSPLGFVQTLGAIAEVALAAAKGV